MSRESRALPGDSLASASACVRCGACMAVCPLYRLTGREGAVARGKLTLWELFKSGQLTDTRGLRDLLEFCLLCGACVDSCAVGLAVPELVKEARFRLRGAGGAAFRPGWWLARAAWQAPSLIPALAWAAPLVNRLKEHLGAESGLIYRLWPGLSLSLGNFPDVAALPFRRRVPSLVPGRGRLRIAFFSGCGVEALFPRVGVAFLRLCAALGIEVVIPPRQGCCGLLPESAGEGEISRRLAREVVNTFGPLPVDFLVTACASCSFQLKRLGTVLKNTPEAGAAGRLAGKVREAGEFLVRELNYRPRPRPVAEGVVYHDPCHLFRGQGLGSEPRTLLLARTGESYREPETRDCCGLGGLFGASFPRISRELGHRRLAALESTGAGLVVTSCSGCLIQLGRLRAPGKVVHLVELLAGPGEAGA